MIFFSDEGVSGGLANGPATRVRLRDHGLDADGHHHDVLRRVGCREGLGRSRPLPAPPRARLGRHSGAASP